MVSAMLAYGFRFILFVLRVIWSKIGICVDIIVRNVVTWF